MRNQGVYLKQISLISSKGVGSKSSISRFRIYITVFYESGGTIDFDLIEILLVTMEISVVKKEHSLCQKWDVLKNELVIDLFDP